MPRAGPGMVAAIASLSTTSKQEATEYSASGVNDSECRSNANKGKRQLLGFQ
jgi:hypothetical protein